MLLLRKIDKKKKDNGVITSRWSIWLGLRNLENINDLIVKEKWCSDYFWIKSLNTLLLFSRFAFLRQLSTAVRTMAFAWRISTAEKLCSTIPKGPGCSTLTTVSISCSSCLYHQIRLKTVTTIFSRIDKNLKQAIRMILL